MEHAHDPAHLLKHALAGVGAGLAGTAVMFAMRSFDQRYASETVPKGKDPGLFLVLQGERLLPHGADVPPAAERGAAVATHVAYGTLYGLLFSAAKLVLPQKQHPFVFGGVLGTAVWAIGHLGLLPGLKLGAPAWDQDQAELAGELTRHVAYGVATAAAYNTIHDAL